MTIDQLLQSAIDDGAFPGAAYVYGTPDQFKFGFVGSHTFQAASPKVGPETLWDLASVTKVVSTTSTAMVLHASGRLDLDAHITAFLPQYRHDHVTVRDALLHRSGMPAYCSFQNFAKTPEESEKKLFDLDLRPAIPAKTEYSCLGFMLLQRVMQSITSEPLNVMAKRMVFDPLGMKSAQYNPSLELRSTCAPTETFDPWRKTLEDERGYKRVQDQWIQGSVHDPAAFMMGGVSGNAGLFASIGDLQKWLHELVIGGEKVFAPATLKEWIRKQKLDSTRALGFDTRSETGSSAGRRFHMKSFGHTGFTGTTVWIDPVNRIYASLLTNRVHPTAENAKITKVRPAFHDLVWEAVRSDRRAA